jgi:hypothetical protein
MPMIWKARIRWWLGAVILFALTGFLLAAALKYVERGGHSPATVLGEAMSKAARQRELTP